MFKIVPNLSLLDGIQALRMSLAKCWFDHKCEEGIECLRQYQREWDDDKRCFKDKPRHDWTSHLVDAARMMAVAWQEEVKTIPQDNTIRGVVVGNNEVTLNELWQTSTPRQSGRI